MLKKVGIMLLFAAVAMIAMSQPARAQGTPTTVSAVVLHSFSGGPTQGGLDLSFYVLPKKIPWAADHICLDAIVTGTTWDTTKAGLGASVNLMDTKTTASLKLGAGWVPDMKWVWLVGVGIPL